MSGVLLDPCFCTLQARGYGICGVCVCVCGCVCVCVQPEGARETVALSLLPPQAPNLNPPVWAELGGQHLQCRGRNDNHRDSKNRYLKSPIAQASTFALLSYESIRGKKQGRGRRKSKEEKKAALQKARTGTGNAGKGLIPGEC